MVIFKVNLPDVIFSYLLHPVFHNTLFSTNKEALL
jgi:hypothetical protein